MDILNLNPILFLNLLNVENNENERNQEAYRREVYK